jgi:hypothetical protein
MLKKILYLFMAFLAFRAVARIASNSAPSSSTGAPGEVNCTVSGCHHSFALNSGAGSLSLKFDNAQLSYVPGKTYHITAELDHPGLHRFGFQLVALHNNDNSNAGALSVTETSRTQIISGAAEQ